MQESRELSAADFHFTKSALTFYIEAARHALPAANLTQFANCISAIGRFRDFPSAETHEGMVEQYELLRWNERSYNRAFTAAKEFYTGLASILEKAVDGFDSVNLSDVFAFQEAKWHAARAVGADPYEAQRSEDAFQNALWLDVFQTSNINGEAG